MTEVTIVTMATTTVTSRLKRCSQEDSKRDSFAIVTIVTSVIIDFCISIVFTGECQYTVNLKIDSIYYLFFITYFTKFNSKKKIVNVEHVQLKY